MVKWWLKARKQRVLFWVGWVGWDGRCCGAMCPAMYPSFRRGDWEQCVVHGNHESWKLLKMSDSWSEYWGWKTKKQNAPDLTWQDMNDDLTGTCALRRIHWIWLNQMQFQNWALVFEPIQNSKFDPKNTCEFMIQPIFGVDFERSWAPGPPASAALASSVQCIWCAKSDFWKLHNLHMHMTCTWHAHDMHMTCTWHVHALHMHCTCSHFWTIFETDKRKQTGNKQDKLGISCHKLGRFLASKHKTHCANTSKT